MSLLEEDIIEKEQVKKVPKVNTNDNSKEYKVKAIWNNIIYTKKLKSGQLAGLYYLITWKGYPKEKNTWELLSGI